MLVPSCDNNIGIVVNNKLNLLHVTSLDTMAFTEMESLTIIFELCKPIFALYMHVYRVMLLTVKEERVSKKPKYLWHWFIQTFDANIGIVFYIGKLICK